MLNRLRRKFILVAMGSLSAVLLAFVILLNAGNYITSTAAADQMLVSIAESEGELPEYSGDLSSQMPWDYPITQETQYETRYFLIWADKDQSVTSLQLDFISAVSGSNAEAYLQEAMEQQSSFGYIDHYRFYRCEREDGYLLVFLDCARQLQTMQNVLLISLLGSALLLAATGVMAFLFSKRAIRPMVKSVEHQKQFITDASHEIRTPLTAISAACDLMLMDDPENELLAAIHQETNRLGKLTADLVTLSRLDEEHPYPERFRFSLSQTAWEIVDAFQATARSAGKKLEASISDQLYCYGEEPAIQRVLSILLDNAVKYAPAGSTIRFAAAQTGKFIFIETVNACQPMTAAQLGHLFDRFYRADPSRARSTGGSGIGLSMAKAIVEAHGGQIRAWCSQREPDQIHFQVRLRTAAEEASTAEKQKSRSPLFRLKRNFERQ